MNHWDEAKKYLINGTGTLSKQWTAYTDSAPSHLLHQQGIIIVTGDDDLYIDWVGALGANLDNFGVSMSLPSIFEITAAKLLCERFPIDKVKILKSGSAACAAAVRIARAYTGHKWVYGMGYHGFLEPFIAAEEPGAGCVPGFYQKFQSIKEMLNIIDINGHSVAAVIVEPVMLDNSQEWISEIKHLRRVCHKKGILFIADEIITGDRYHDYSVCKHYDLNPDIMCLGKALAGGHAIGVVGCKRGMADMVESKGIFISTTFSGVVNDLTAMINHLQNWTEVDIEILWLRGERLMKCFNRIDSRVQLIGYPTRMSWIAEDRLLAAFFDGMLSRGHLLGKAFFISSGHTDDIINNFLDDASTVLSGPMDYNGRLPQPAFKR